MEKESSAVRHTPLPEFHSCGIDPVRGSRRWFIAALLASAAGCAQNKKDGEHLGQPELAPKKVITEPKLDPKMEMMLRLLTPPEQRPPFDNTLLHHTVESASNDDELKLFIGEHFDVIAGNSTVEDARIICLTDLHTDVFPDDNQASSSLLKRLAQKGDIILVEAAFSDHIEANAEILDTGDLELAGWDEKKAHETALHIITRFHGSREWLKKKNLLDSKSHVEYLRQWTQWFGIVGIHLRNDAMRKKIEVELLEREGSDARVYVWGGKAHFTKDTLLLTDLQHHAFIILSGKKGENELTEHERRKLSDKYIQTLLTDEEVEFFRPPDIREWYRNHGREFTPVISDVLPRH